MRYHFGRNTLDAGRIIVTQLLLSTSILDAKKLKINENVCV